MVVGGYRINTLVRSTARHLWAHGVLGLGAQTAYYFFFSLFPILLFSAPLLSLVGDRRRTMEAILTQIAPVVPSEAYALIQSVLQDVVFSSGAPGVMSVGALLALWSGSNVFSSLADALNRAYGVPERRPFWKVSLIAMAFVIGAGVAMIAATILFVFAEPIVHALADLLGLGDVGVALWSIVQVGIAIALVVAVGAAVFYILPSVRLMWREALLGSVVATALWIVVTAGFRLYVENFSTYNRTYGTIGGVIVLLTWMYLSMLAVLVGGEFAAEMHAGTGRVASA